MRESKARIELPMHHANAPPCPWRQVALSPHVYGPAVTSAPAAWAGPDLHARLTASFGYATQQGRSRSPTLLQPFYLMPATMPRSRFSRITTLLQLFHLMPATKGAAQGAAGKGQLGCERSGWLAAQVWAPLAGAFPWLWASSALSSLRCCPLLCDITHRRSQQSQS
jgi:hypothetical protein